MSIIEALSRNVLDTRFESFDKETIEQAKNRIIDVVGCLIGGADSPDCRMVMDMVKGWGGAEESTILVHGDKVPAHNAAMLNSIMARSIDFDPIEPYVEDVGTPAHVSGTTIPTALAVAEQKKANGKELITSLILGDDIASRLIAASCFSFDLGWDNSGTINTFGATAVAGRLRGLDERQLQNAFGIVLNQMAGSFQNIFDAVHSFKLPMALAARAGIFSAELAGRGFTGIKDPLLSKHGYFALYCRTSNPEIMTRELGKKFYSDRTFKPYPACRSTHSAIDCALQLANNHDIRTEDIEEINIDVTPSTLAFVGRPFEIGEVPQANAAFSLQYNVANALLRQSVRLEHYTEESIRDPRVLELIQKTRLLSTLPPDKRMATVVDVKMKGGKKLSARVEIPKGDPLNNPMTRDDLIEKFITNAGFSGTMTKDRAEKVIRIIERLDEISDITELVNALS